MTKRISTVALLSVLILGSAACSNESDKNDSNNATNKKTIQNDANSDLEDEDLDENFGNEDESEDSEAAMPSTLQVAQMMAKVGMNYHEDLTNPTDQSNKYSSEIDKKLNFGVYSADLAYLIFNEKFGEAQEYMSVIRDLGTETGLDKIFNSEDLLKRFEANQSNQDSLINILIDINLRTEEIFDENPETRKGSIIHFAGAWLEIMYVGSQSIDEDSKSELGTTVVEQMNVLASLIKGLKSIEKDNSSTELSELVLKFEDLEKSFNNLSNVKAAKNNENGNYTDVILSNDEFKALKEKIAQLREDIITA